MTKIFVTGAVQQMNAFMVELIRASELYSHSATFFSLHTIHVAVWTGS